MNTKMIRYILAKMLGVEALLLLLPAFVADDLRRKERRLVSGSDCSFGGALSDRRKKAAEGTDNLWKRRNDYCCFGMDFVVIVWCAAVLLVRVYS